MRHLLLLAVPAALAGCATTADPPGPSYALVGTAGQQYGTISAWETAGGLAFRFHAAGLPIGIHGVHVHAVGRCDGPKFESAGGHWNPASRRHGFNNPDGPHGGDMANVTVAGTGVIQDAVSLPHASFAALADADGAALVLHARSDDYATEPSGNSGDRIACAVIAAPR